MWTIHTTLHNHEVLLLYVYFTTPLCHFMYFDVFIFISCYSKFNHAGGDSENSSVHVSEGGRDSPTRHHSSTNDDEWPVPPDDNEVESDPMYAQVIPKNQRKSEEGVPMRAMYDFGGEDDDDLSFKAGDVVRIIKQCEDGWAQGVMDGKLGYVPFAYFEELKR